MHGPGPGRVRRPGAGASRRARWGRRGRRPTGCRPDPRAVAPTRAAARVRRRGRSVRDPGRRTGRGRGDRRAPTGRARSGLRPADARGGGRRGRRDRRGRRGGVRWGNPHRVPGRVRLAHVRPGRRRGRLAGRTAVVAKRSASFLHGCGGSSERVLSCRHATGAPAGRSGKTIHARPRTVHRTPVWSRGARDGWTARRRRVVRCPTPGRRRPSTDRQRPLNRPFDRLLRRCPGPRAPS